MNVRDVWWQRIRSWHVVVPSRALVPKALCGRTPTGPVEFTLPAGKTCETCLRALAKLEGE